MRSIFAIIITLWYAILSMGFQVHVHYCCGDIAGIAINQVIENEYCCGSHHDGCSIEKTCCSSDDFYVALDEDHNSPSEFVIHGFLPATIQQVVTPTEQQILPIVEEDRVVQINGPPRYLLFESRLIYG